jgi:hypothetical protein
MRDMTVQKTETHIKKEDTKYELSEMLGVLA